jgi:hypothetical protein
MRLSIGLRRGALVAALVATLALPALALAGTDDDLAAAEAGTEAFTDPAAAEAAGYGLPPEGPLHECISSLDDTGAMGLHYINGDLVGDTVLDAAAPEALVYEPAADGSLELVAVEYVVFAEAWDAENDMAPMLFGEMFMLVDEPNRYELPAFYALHAWIWKDNPSGTFASFNPDVTCANAMPNTALPAQATPATAANLLGLVLVAGAVGIALSRRRRRT